MIPYASRTGTRRNLAALRREGFRLLISATGVHRDEGFRYAIDNGAWTAYQQKRPFDGDAFRKLVESHGAGADWIALPDIVGGGMYSLEFSMMWANDLCDFPLLLPVQDGMDPDDVRELVTPTLGIFVGGTTDWKLATMNLWGELAAEKGAYFHVARVNSRRRIAHAAAAGADSFDGTSATRFSVNAPEIGHAARQQSMFSPRKKTS